MWQVLRQLGHKTVLRLAHNLTAKQFIWDKGRNKGSRAVKTTNLAELKGALCRGCGHTKLVCSLRRTDKGKVAKKRNCALCAKVRYKWLAYKSSSSLTVVCAELCAEMISEAFFFFWLWHLWLWSFAYFPYSLQEQTELRDQLIDTHFAVLNRQKFAALCLVFCLFSSLDFAQHIRAKSSLVQMLVAPRSSLFCFLCRMNFQDVQTSCILRWVRIFAVFFLNLCTLELCYSKQSRQKLLAGTRVKQVIFHVMPRFIMRLLLGREISIRVRKPVAISRFSCLW